MLNTLKWVYLLKFKTKNFDYLEKIKIFLDYSTEEEADNEDKAELVTLKYSSAYASHISNQEPEQNWIPLTYLNKNDENSSHLKNMLYCKSLEQCRQEHFSD